MRAARSALHSDDRAGVETRCAPGPGARGPAGQCEYAGQPGNIRGVSTKRALELRGAGEG